MIISSSSHSSFHLLSSNIGISSFFAVYTKRFFFSQCGINRFHCFQTFKIVFFRLSFVRNKSISNKYSRSGFHQSFSFTRNNRCLSTSISIFANCNITNLNSFRGCVRRSFFLFFRSFFFLFLISNVFVGDLFNSSTINFRQTIIPIEYSFIRQFIRCGVSKFINECSYTSPLKR